MVTDDAGNACGPAAALWEGSKGAEGSCTSVVTEDTAPGTAAGCPSMFTADTAARTSSGSSTPPTAAGPEGGWQAGGEVTCTILHMSCVAAGGLELTMAPGCIRASRQGEGGGVGLAQRSPSTCARVFTRDASGRGGLGRASVFTDDTAGAP